MIRLKYKSIINNIYCNITFIYYYKTKLIYYTISKITNYNISFSRTNKLNKIYSKNLLILYNFSLLQWKLKNLKQVSKRHFNADKTCIITNIVKLALTHSN